MTFRSSKARWPGLTWQEGERGGGWSGRNRGGGEDGRKEGAGDGDGGRIWGWAKKMKEKER